MEFIWHLWKLGTDYSAIITAKGHWYFISYRKGSCKYIAMFAANDQLYSYTYWKGSNILQCLQRRTKYITMFATKDQIYYNLYSKGLIIFQYLLERTKYSTIFTPTDQIYYNIQNKGPCNYFLITTGKDQI